MAISVEEREKWSMTGFLGVYMAICVIMIGFGGCLLYLILLAIRAMKKYLAEEVKADSETGRRGAKGLGIALAVGVVVLSAAAGIFRQGSASAISVIGGADGPTSVFVAGKTGIFTMAAGLAGVILNLAFCGGIIYIAILVIKALKKYLRS